MKTLKKTKTVMQLSFEKATKLHQILKIGLHDLAKAERSKKYIIDMDIWYKPNSHCTICLAGSVMASRYNSLANKYAKEDARGECLSNYFEIAELANKFDALNHLRTGLVSNAFSCVDPNHSIDSVEYYDARKLDRSGTIMNYLTNREEWWGQMKQLLKDLRKANI